MKDRFADYAPMSQEVIHPLEKEKLVYHIKHLGYKEPDLPKKPDFICQYENMFRRNQTSDHDIHNDMSVQDHGCNSAQSVTHPDYPQCLNYPSDKADERTPMSKKRKLLDSFNTFSGGPQGHTESHSIPRPQPTIPPLKLKISLKKKEHDSPNTGKVQPDTPKKEYPKSTVSLDATTIQKLKILMNPKSPSKNPPQLTTDSTPASCVDPQQPRGTNNAEIPMPPSSRALTSAQVRSILAIDDIVDVSQLANSDAWVRRSTRQPSRSSITSNHVQTLVEKLRMNDPDVVVLKMKQYLSDPNTPSVILDTVLDALEENTNCQALYIQNFNEGIRDEQFLHLLRILQRPQCNIWCINVGEIYKVKTRTWAAFTEGLTMTKVTHMYASEHIISSAMKEMMREIIRDNRKKHSMHSDPDNLHVIVQCTHNWWNPINAVVLRPFLQDRGYEYLLADKIKQGIKGTKTDLTNI